MEKRNYSALFWDYPEIELLAKSFSREDFREFIYHLKRKDLIRFNLILRRFLERARFHDIFFFFSLEDIEKGLKEFHFWNKISPVRLHALRHALEFMEERKKTAVHG